MPEAAGEAWWWRPTQRQAGPRALRAAGAGVLSPAFCEGVLVSNLVVQLNVTAGCEASRLHCHVPVLLLLLLMRAFLLLLLQKMLFGKSATFVLHLLVFFTLSFCHPLLSVPKKPWS